MTAVLVRARSELRARIPSMLALALLLGLGAGVVMTTAAGARRTDTAYPRFARAYLPANLLVYQPPPQTSGVQFAHYNFAQLAQLPEVAAASVLHYLGAEPSDLAILAGDPTFGVTIDRTKILQGQAANPDSLDEVVIGFDFARKRHLHVGSLIHVGFGVTETHVIPWTLRVVGIGATPGEFPPQIGTNGPGTNAIHATPALYKSLVKQNVFTFTFLLIRLKPGAAEAKALNDDLNRLANGNPQGSTSLDAQGANVQRSIHLQAVALWIVAALVALIACLIFSQLLARQATLDAAEGPTLLALGMTRWQLWLAGMSRMATIGIAGAAFGVLAAYLASSLMPIGVARNAEPNAGMSFDFLVLGVAAAGIVAVVLSLSAWPVWKSTRMTERQRARSERPSFVSRTATAPGLSAPASTGLRLALEPGHGPTAVPVRSSLLSVALAIVALTGALSFGASLDHLLSTPRLYGWNWDVHVTTGSAQDDTQALKMLLPDSRIQDVAEIDGPPVVLDGKAHFDLLGLYQRKGLIQPIIVDGRMAETPDEIVLGVKTVQDVHAHIGSTVTMYISAIKTISAQYKVVGTAVIPPNSDSSRLGEGAITIRAGTLRMAPPGFQIPAPSDLYMNFAPGVNKKAAEADLTKEFGQQYSLLLVQRPTDLVNFGQVQNLPLLLAGLVALLAAATLAHTLVTSIRRRRRDLAILKMLGFVPSQVRWTVAWQATTFVSVALLIGLPAGIAVGRVIWSAFATNLGTLPKPVTPSLALLLTIPAAVVLANMIAVVPAVMAGRMRPAPALRAE